MDSLITPATFIFFFLTSTFGLGKTAAHFFYWDGKTGWAFAASLGIAVLIAFGGILNVFHVAYPVVLISSLILGVILAIVHLCLAMRNRIKFSTEIFQMLRNPATRLRVLEDIFLLLFFLATLIFLTYFLMPTCAFNFHDDFHTYLDWPLQMLQTGSLSSNSFSPLGFHYLGGQSFMQAFSQVFFDIRFINVFDAIICFVLGMGVLAEFGRKMEAGFASILISVTLFVFINSFYVNISALYSGSLMILGLVFSTYRLRKICTGPELPERKRVLLAIVPVALFYAALATLKANFIIFLILYFLICFAGDGVWSKNKKLMFKTNLGTVLAGFLLLVPWLAISADKYLKFIQFRLICLNKKGSLTFRSEIPVLSTDKISKVFSTADIFWGNSFPDYLMILIALGIFTLAGTYYLFKRHESLPYEETMPLMAAAGACVAAFFFYFLSLNHPTSGIIRYSTPIMISVLPLTTLLAGRFVTKNTTDHENRPPRLLTQVMSLLLALHLVIAGAFLGTLIDRFERIVERRMMLSFPVGEIYFEFMKSALSRKREKKIRDIQLLTEKGTKLLAWISTPFNLDFSRNRILLVKCLLLHLRGISSEVDSNELLRYFREKGIRYIIWEYKGFAVKSTDYYRSHNDMGSLYFRNALSEIARKTKVIYHQDSILVLDIGR